LNGAYLPLSGRGPAPPFAKLGPAGDADPGSAAVMDHPLGSRPNWRSCVLAV
jgi:hypothetical protein